MNIKYNEQNVARIVMHYQNKFQQKTFVSLNPTSDILMDLFGITYEQKQENMQYWNRELGSLWEEITKEIFRTNSSFREPLGDEFGTDKPVDYFLGNMAIDAKYRIGSGDSGTLKKFKYYGEMLKQKGYNPIFLILRDDNLPNAITAAQNGGWTIYTHKGTFDFIINNSRFDIVKELAFIKTKYLG